MLTLISPPYAPPVTLAEVKAALAIIGSADDAFLSSLIGSATQAFDGPSGKLGRCLVAQSWRLDVSAFPAGPLRIPMPPIISVESVGYVDTSGDAQEFEDYSVTGLGSPDGATITPATSWPAGSDIAIEFVAGFGEDVDVPQDIRDAIIATVGSRFAWREASILATGTLNSNPEIEDTVSRWKVWGFGG